MLVIVANRPALISVMQGRPFVALLDVDEEHAACLRVERADRLLADLHDARFVGGSGERRRRRHAARAPVLEVRDAFGHLREHHGAVVPEALDAEVATREVLGQSEGSRGHPAHLLPVGDPASHLLRAFHRDGAVGTGARADPAPELLMRTEALKQRLDPGRVRDRVGQRGRNAATAQKCSEGVLVLAPLDDRGAREEGAAPEPVPERRDCAHVVVVRRQEQIDVLALDDPPQGRRVGLGGHREQAVAVGSGFPEKEPAVVAADDHERRVAGSQAADEVVARGRACVQDEHRGTHAGLLSGGPCMRGNDNGRRVGRHSGICPRQPERAAR